MKIKTRHWVETTFGQPGFRSKTVTERVTTWEFDEAVSKPSALYPIGRASAVWGALYASTGMVPDRAADSVCGLTVQLYTTAPDEQIVTYSQMEPGRIWETGHVSLDEQDRRQDEFDAWFAAKFDRELGPHFDKEKARQVLTPY